MHDIRENERSTVFTRSYKDENYDGNENSDNDKGNDNNTDYDNADDDDIYDDLMNLISYLNFLLFNNNLDIYILILSTITLITT